MIHIQRYNSTDKALWDSFVKKSKNGTFLLLRDYMDYHSDRFHDASLLFFDEKERLTAVLPANIRGKRLASHDGLTYGGLVMDSHVTTSVVTEMFHALKRWMKDEGIETLRYKPTPYIYHSYPAEEDLYALLQCFDRVSIESRDVSTAIPLCQPRLPWRELRRRGVRKAARNGIYVRETKDFTAFWKMLDDNLHAKYATHPVHTLEEITRLAESFPENIRLFMAYKDDRGVAGIVMYEANAMTVHSQYISSTPEGRSVGALDALVHHLVTEVYTSQAFFDFGKSTEGDDSRLNANLIFQKEGFGGRAVCYDTYSVSDTSLMSKPL